MASESKGGHGGNFQSCGSTGVFRLGLRRMVMLRRECAELKRYLKEMQLADRNIDATDTGIPPLLQV